LAVYEYVAFDERGKEIKGIIDADSPRLARQKLRASGIFPISLKEEQKEASEVGTKDISLRWFTKRIKLADITVMTRQLATLVGAGLPLVTSLNGLLEQTENPALKRIIAQIREKVNEGNSLAAALSEHPRVFSPLFVNMVEAGEASGTLELVLERLADFIEQQQSLRYKIYATLAYPTIMLVIGASILFFLITFVIPAVTKIFEKTQQALPLPTVILIGISNFLKHYWWLLGLIFVVIMFAFKKFVSTPRGREWFDRVKLTFPIIGKINRKIAVARFSRTLGVLLKNGTPLLTALDIVRNILNNVVLSKVLEKAKDEIVEGEGIAGPLARTKAFPPIVIQMIGVGEKSGTLEDMLEKVASSYEEEIEMKINALTALLEPVMILVMGAAVGFIVLSILLPILQMSTIVK